MDQFVYFPPGDLSRTELIVDATPSISPCSPVTIVKSRHHASSRWGTKGTPVGLGKPCSFSGQPVDIRCAKVLLTITTQHTLPQIVGINKNDVGFILHIQWLNLSATCSLSYIPQLVLASWILIRPSSFGI